MRNAISWTVSYVLTLFYDYAIFSSHLHNIYMIFGVAISDKFLSPKTGDFTKHALALLNPENNLEKKYR